MIIWLSLYFEAIMFSFSPFPDWETSVTLSTPCWWFSSGGCSSPAPRWPEISGTLLSASVSSFSLTSVHPAPWPTESSSLNRKVLTFSCQLDMTSETLTIHEGHSKTLLWVWISRRLSTGEACGSVKHSKGKKRGWLAMNYLLLFFLNPVHSPDPSKKMSSFILCPMFYSQSVQLYMQQNAYCDFHFIFQIIVFILFNPSMSPCLVIILSYLIYGSESVEDNFYDHDFYAGISSSCL